MRKKRRKLPKKVSKKIFSATAQNVDPRNIQAFVSRGGIRL